MRLEAQDLLLAEADGAPLFAIGKLAVELQWKSLSGVPGALPKSALPRRVCRYGTAQTVHSGMPAMRDISGPIEGCLRPNLWAMARDDCMQSRIDSKDLWHKRFTVQTALRSPRMLVIALDLPTVNVKGIGDTMNMKLAITCFVAAALVLPITSYAADSDSSSATVFVKDSVITTQVKAELAEKKLSTLVHISVDTDKDGMVVLSGTAPSKDAVNKAVLIARAVKGVTSVENHIQIAAD